MPPSAHTPAELRNSVFLGRDAVAAGLLTWRQLQGTAWRSLMRGVYAHGDVPVTHELRARAACLLVPNAVVTGRSAAVLWDLDLAGATDDVELTLPRGAHPVRIQGVRTRRAAMPAERTWRRRDLPVTTPEATAARLASVLPLDDAVAATDQLIEAGFADLRRMRTFAESLRGPGAARARKVASLADGLAGSPQETRVRLLIGRSHLPMPVAQFTIRDADGRIGRVDFAWPEHKVALEYDGLWHAENRQFAKDRHRLNRLRAAGWQVVFVTAAMLYEPEKLIAMIAAALGVQNPT